MSATRVYIISYFYVNTFVRLINLMKSSSRSYRCLSVNNSHLLAKKFQMLRSPKIAT